MPIELKMPALSPTMEEGTLAKWLVKEGDEVKSGDILAEIETDKATMEFEAVDEGKIAKILVPEGTDGVKVGAPIAIMAGEGEDASRGRSAAPKADTAAAAAAEGAAPAPKADARHGPLRRRRSRRQRAAACRATSASGRPDQGIAAGPPPRRRRKTSTCRALKGSGPGGRIVRADIDGAAGKAPAAAPPPQPPQPRRPPARISSCPGRSSRPSRTRRSSSPTCARPSPAA